MKTRSWMIISLVTLSLLLVSLLANVVIFNQAQQYYHQLNGVRLDPLGMRAYPAKINKPIPTENQKSVVFLGDSRAFAWPAPDDQPHFVFTNRGIGSQTTEQVLRRYEAHVKPLSADVVVLQVGINDLKTIPLFLDQKKGIIDRTETNIATIVELARQDGSIVILTTVFPLGAVPMERRFFWSPDVAEAIDEVNTFLYTLASDEVILFDTSAVLAGEDGQVKPEFSFDLLHLTPAGYEALNQPLVDLLQQRY
ncbi:MAG: SGNH/GDSL hydrolase family protein [Anaerolineae bacterium]|nr:SGNH/GDSL hydrolase family protein [Anaerolineae bacterium]